MSIGHIHIEVDLARPQTRRYLASETFSVTAFDGSPLSAEELAPALLKAWKAALAQAEETLLLYGFEGVAE
jgi:hypothetical protein